MHIAANMMMKALQTGTMDLRQSVVKAILQDESERGVEGWREGRSGWWDEGTRGGGAEEGGEVPAAYGAVDLLSNHNHNHNHKL